MKSVRPRLPKYVTADPGRDGVERFYIRRPGQKKIRLHGVPWTPPFMAQYSAAFGGTNVVIAPPLAKDREGTFAWLCQQYFDSAEFKSLATDTTAPHRRSELMRICREPTKPNSTVRFGQVPISQWTRKAVRAIRDRFADTPGAATNLVKALRAVFRLAIDLDLIEVNPTSDVKGVASENPDGHHTWTIEEVEQFESHWPVGSKERLALGLMLYTGQRISDAQRLGPPHVKDREDGKWIVFTQHKNRRRKPVHMEIPLRPELEELIAATPIGSETFLTNERFGKPMERGVISKFFKKACEAAGVPGRGHGLRKAAAVRLAENGATEKEIASITGHRTLAEIQRYTAAARQKTLAVAATDKVKR